MNSAEALLEAVGWKGRRRIDVVESRHLRAFLHATGEPDLDRRQVPPTFVACFLDEPPPIEAAENFGLGWLNGGDRFDWSRSIQVGDTLASQSVLADVTFKDGRSGRLAILKVVTEFRGRDRQLIVTHTGTRIRR